MTFSKSIFLNLLDTNKEEAIDYFCKYDTINIKYKYTFDELFQNNKFAKHYIDNENVIINNDNSYKKIHFICHYSTPEMIKYIIDKGVDLEAIDRHGMRPIHFICLKSIPEMIKYIIDKGIDLEAKTNFGWHPIHFICRYSTSEIIRYTINKGVDLNCVDNENKKPLDNLYKNSQVTPETIQYMIYRMA